MNKAFKRRKIRKNNPIAKALRHPSFRHKVIPAKKGKFAPYVRENKQDEDD